MPFVVHQFADFTLHCGTYELCRKRRRLKLEQSLSNCSSSWSPNTDRLLPGMKLPRAFGSGKSSLISNTGSTRQSVKFARFLVTVRTCRSLCRQSPALVTASSHPLRPLSRKSPRQINRLGIQSTCLLRQRKSLLRRKTPPARHAIRDQIPSPILAGCWGFCLCAGCLFYIHLRPASSGCPLPRSKRPRAHRLARRSPSR